MNFGLGNGEVIRKFIEGGSAHTVFGQLGEMPKESPHLGEHIFAIGTFGALLGPGIRMTSCAKGAQGVVDVKLVSPVVGSVVRPPHNVGVRVR